MARIETIMKIIKQFPLNTFRSLQEDLQKHKIQNGMFVLIDKSDKKIAIISATIFERIVWFFQACFCVRNYYKFSEVFNSKKVKFLSSAEIEYRANREQDWEWKLKVPADYVRYLDTQAYLLSNLRPYTLPETFYDSDLDGS
jgi:hypothetical protein